MAGWNEAVNDYERRRRGITDGGKSSLDRFKEMDQAERLRVAALIVADGEHSREEMQALTNEDGTRQRSKPTDHVAMLRRQRSNGMPEHECTDTIGRAWAFGLLDGARFAPDLLRDAGRRYAASYWFRYGSVCAHIGSYGEMSGRSSGPPSVVIADPEKDAIADARFRRRDDALRGLKHGRRVKDMVDLMCVDGAGDNDPGFLSDLIAGYPAETKNLRTGLAMKEAKLDFGSKDERRRAQRLVDDANREINRKLRSLRQERLPHADLVLLRDGLTELAAIDQSEGLHKKMKRGVVVSGGE